MPLPAVDPRAAVPGVERQQILEQRQPAELLHRGADRQLNRAQAVALGRQRARRQVAESPYLRRDLRLELDEEPPLSSSVSPGAVSSASADTGRAAQIAELTSTISPTIALKRL